MWFAFKLMLDWRDMTVTVHLAPWSEAHSLSVQCYEFCLHAILFLYSFRHCLIWSAERCIWCLIKPLFLKKCNSVSVVEWGRRRVCYHRAAPASLLLVRDLKLLNSLSSASPFKWLSPGLFQALIGSNDLVSSKLWLEQSDWSWFLRQDLSRWSKTVTSWYNGR